MKRFALVYQGGLANVFDISHSGDMPEIAPFTDEGKHLFKSRERLLQADFRACEYYCHGAAAAGVAVRVYHYDGAGDAALADWEKGPGDVFAGHKQPPLE